MNNGEYTISELQDLFATGASSAADICRAYLDRIGEIDRAGPTLCSVIEVNPDALAIAQELDEERRRNGPRGPLHGVPILIKDNIDTGDAMMTTAGSLALEGNVAGRDAHVVRRLRAAGAVLLGKTNLSEWAFFRSPHGISGWSSRGGQTRNPYALDRSPSGSSSGSGAAVAANLCTVAIGTETDGSIISPSSINGIVGLKPTVGLVSRSGIIPIAASQDTAGPMARTVADAAAVLTAIAGPDATDPVTKTGADRASVDYGRFLQPNGLQGARLGVARDFFGRHGAVDAAIERAIARLSELGATVVDPVRFPTLADVSQAESLVMLREFKVGVARYLADHEGAPVRSLADVIAFNREHADIMMPLFGQEVLERAEALGEGQEADYQAARAECLRLARDDGLDRALGEDDLDAIIAPSTDPAWLVDPVLGDTLIIRGTPRSYHLPAVAGYPHITVPAGFVKGLPVGLSFFGGPFEEGRLIQYAFAFEQATQARRPPTFPETLTG